MIYSILLISRGGVPVYKKILRRLPVSSDKMDEESLVASIITAVIDMSKEIFGQSISSFHLENLEVSIGSSEKAIVAVVADKGDREALELSRSILSSIDKLLDYPDFEDGLVLSTATERIEQFIESIIEEISSPINKSIAILDDLLLLAERERFYEPREKSKAKTMAFEKSFLSIIKTRLLKNEKEGIQTALEVAKKGRFEEALTILSKSFTNTYFGNIVKMLFIKLGLIANMLRKDISAPTFESLLRVFGEINLDDFKKKGKENEFEKLAFLKDNLYRQVESIINPDNYVNEFAYFRAIKNKFRDVISSAGDELEKKSILLIMMQPNACPPILAIISKNWSDISDYFIETWFMLDKLETYKIFDYWEDFVGRIEDLNRLFYKMKRWSKIAPINLLPLYIDVLTKVDYVKDSNLTTLKDIMLSLNSLYENDLKEMLKDPLLITRDALNILTIGTLINIKLVEISPSEEKKNISHEFFDRNEDLISDIVENYLVRNPNRRHLYTVAPILIYNLAILGEYANKIPSELFDLINEFLTETKERLSKKNRSSLRDIEAIGYIISIIPHFLKFSRGRVEGEKLLAKGAELLEFIRSRLKSFRSLYANQMFIKNILEYYTMIINFTREKSLADFVLLKSISLAEEAEDNNLNSFLVSRALLDTYLTYIRKFGPMVPNWQKPIRECEKTIEILRRLKGDENLIAEIWKTCHDLRNLVKK